MDWSNTWIGMAGAGLSAGAVIGGSAFWVTLHRMDGKNIPLEAIVFGTRVGVMANAELAHGVCLLSNVREPNDVTEIKSGGLDFGISVGMKIDAAMKSGGKLVSLVSKLAKASLKGSVTGARVTTKVATSAAEWATQEPLKKAVQGLMDDFEIHPSKPCFLLIPSPAAAGVGGGIWYEWQTLSRASTDAAYKYIKPLWSVKGTGADARIRLSGVPEISGTKVHFHLLQPVTGVDYVMHFAANASASTTVDTDSFPVQIKEGHAYFDGELGIPVGRFHCIGYTRGGALGIPVNETKLQTHKKMALYGAFSRAGSNIYKWTSDSRISARTDGFGRLMLSPTQPAN